MTKLSVLTVDDAAFIRDLIKRTLRGFFPDIYIDEAPNGKKAQTLLQRNQYDLVLCDWEMPEASGLEVLNWLREQEKADGLEKTPFIMVTSRGDRKNVVEAVESGVTDYIGKPFSNEQLLRKVVKALSNHHKSYIAGLLSRNKDVSDPFAKRAEKTATPETQSGSNLLAANSSTEQFLTKPITSKPSKLGKSNKGSAVFRTSNSESVGKIRDITLHEILLQLPRSQDIPVLFDQVVVDIEIKDQSGGIARINGFVWSTSIPDKQENTEHIQVGIKYVDADPEKMEILARFINHNA